MQCKKITTISVVKVEDRSNSVDSEIKPVAAEASHHNEGEWTDATWGGVGLEIDAKSRIGGDLGDRVSNSRSNFKAFLN